MNFGTDDCSAGRSTLVTDEIDGAEVAGLKLTSIRFSLSAKIVDLAPFDRAHPSGTLTEIALPLGV